jgi:hypothetical protein
MLPRSVKTNIVPAGNARVFRRKTALIRTFAACVPYLFDARAEVSTSLWGVVRRASFAGLSARIDV